MDGASEEVPLLSRPAFQAFGGTSGIAPCQLAPILSEWTPRLLHDGELCSCLLAQNGIKRPSGKLAYEFVNLAVPSHGV